ncbi:O-antigen ligase family protein [Vibrio cincinnatiensis]|uniref:O-antigen ligase family protein n=1 Tax=Vibrio cincinnatiensis TaxID=675 RepID=UPI001EDF1DDA|nr:O-antigen ligase family protein [Vibrio cincinnatiensis]MCG3759545.1 O-antigen ligase family protein [Vibrio cincinnatiensis]MCG3762847.1 O-antigen ligase family protein [Vibrio cincinnatiensis]
MNIKVLSNHHIINFLILSPYFFSFSFLMLLENSSKIVVPIIILSCIITLSSENNIIKVIRENISSPLYCGLIIYTIYSIFSYYYHGFSSRELRALICLTILFFTFPFYRIDISILKGLIYLGCSTVFINSIYHNVYLGEYRWAGTMNPIPYATICASLFIACFSIFLCSNKNIERIISCVFLVFSATSILLTQSRGVWLAVFISIIALLTINIRHTKIERKYIAIIISSVIFTFFLMKESIEQRIDQTKQEILLISHGDLKSSIGLRLQMWLSVPDVIKDNYIIGIGDTHEKILKILYKEGEISPSLHKFSPSHYHNQYLDRLVKMGILGLLMLIAILLSPLRGITQQNRLRQCLIIGTISTYFISSLTDVPFNHPQSLTIYLLLLFPLCKRETKHNG